jgi:hypothetical protein
LKDIIVVENLGDLDKNKVCKIQKLRYIAIKRVPCLPKLKCPVPFIYLTHVICKEF